MSMDVPADREADALNIGRASDGSVPLTAHRSARRAPDSSYENYLFGNAGAEDQPSWSDSAHGRATIRLFSRGVVGAACFAIGGRYARQQMSTYNEATWDSSKPLHWVAKGIDVTFGKVFKKAIFTAAEAIGKDGARTAENAMTFRQSRSFDLFDKQGNRMLAPTPDGMVGPFVSVKGRSYGAEVVSFTFDFASASTGDATTRKLIGLIDPNVKHTWLVNDEGKPAMHGEHKHFVFNEWLKATVKSSWVIFSKNQGEDWFAAIPYAFQMKFQSKLLNSAFAGKRANGKNRFEGHDIVFDESWNGGAYRRDANGTIIGDYQLPAALDLHARFVGYNWYTLMGREGWDWMGNALNQWKQDGYAIHAPHLPEHFNPLTAAVDGLAQTGRYLTKSFIKANVYMNPAVVPFWILRASQSKWRGEFAVAEMGAKMGAGKPVKDPYAVSNYDHYADETKMDKFEKGFSKTLNGIGELQYKVGMKAGEKLGHHLPNWKWLNKLVTPHGNYTHADLARGRSNLIHEWTDAAFSYTPYMWAKGETGMLVDDNKGDGKPGQFDAATYRFMDSVAAFNGHETWQALKDMGRLATHYEYDYVREGDKLVKIEPKAIRTQTFADRVAPASTVAETTEDNASERFMDSIATNNGHASWKDMKAATPTNTVAAGNVVHEPASLSRRAGDAKPVDEDKNWVESIQNSKANPAQVMSASATYH